MLQHIEQLEDEREAQEGERPRRSERAAANGRRGGRSQVP
jgi:hypothetical protein